MSPAFLLFFSFLLLPLILNRILPLEEALNSRVKELTRKFVKEIKTMLFRHFPKGKHSLYAAPTIKLLVSTREIFAPDSFPPLEKAHFSLEVDRTKILPVLDF